MTWKINSIWTSYKTAERNTKATIMKTRNVLSSMLRTAAEWEIIYKNPCEKIRLHAEDAPDKIKFFTPEQAMTFLDYIEKPYQVQIGGHKRTYDTGIPYTVGDYTITKSIPEQIRILFTKIARAGGNFCWPTRRSWPRP